MIRFFGMMPANEVEITKRYYDCNNCHVATIQAGYHGWALLYADLSSQYNDMDDTPENNFSSSIKGV